MLPNPHYVNASQRSANNHRSPQPPLPPPTNPQATSLVTQNGLSHRSNQQPIGSSQPPPTGQGVRPPPPICQEIFNAQFPPSQPPPSYQPRLHPATAIPPLFQHQGSQPRPPPPIFGRQPTPTFHSRPASRTLFYEYYSDSLRRSPRGRSFVSTFMMDRGNAFACMKYTLLLCNLFGFILAIFNALFGIGYPKEKWPGGYTGNQMAIFSLFVMVVTSIGFCGTKNLKGYLLIVYGIIIFFLLIGIVAIIFIYNDVLAEFMYNGYIISFAVIIFFLMLFAFFLSYKISENHSNKYLSTIIPTAQQRQMTISGSQCSTHPGNTNRGEPGVGTGGGGGAMTICPDNRRQNNTQFTNVSGSSPRIGPPGCACPVPGCNYGKIISN